MPSRLANPPTPSITDRAIAARAASRILATKPTGTKNAVLLTLADLIDDLPRRATILEANDADMAAARSANLPAPKLARLELTPMSLVQLGASLRQIAELPDPVGRVTLDSEPSKNLGVRKVRAPLGVIAMIYEARPGVTIDAFALCFKAGNSCILRGGKEAQLSNAALTALAHEALERHSVPRDALVNLSGTSRADLETLLTLKDHIDLVIPRGGRELIELVTATSRIPTVQHYRGICHIYIDESADIDMAINICATAKTSAPATCNAAECILVHREIAAIFIPRMLARYAADGVEVRGTPTVVALAGEVIADCGSRIADSNPSSNPHSEIRNPKSKIVPAQPEDFGREFLDLIIAMRIVDGIDQAVDHIATYGSNHTEAIVTGDTRPGGAADRFAARVQSSCVVVNASTRMNDGFSLGLGAEIGISTSRVHAYGPMGLEELTTQRWVVTGTGQTR